MLILLLSSLFACAPSDTKYNVYNTEPGASITSPVDGQAFDEGSSVTFLGRVVDNQDEPGDLYLTWSSDLDGVLQEGRLADVSGDVSFVTANLSVGSHAIKLTANDTSQAQGFASVGVVIVDVEERPRVNILAPVGSDFGIEGLEYTLRAGVTDEQDAPSSLLLIITSDLEGELCRVAPAADNIATCDVLLSVGTHLLTFTAWDSGGDTAEATAYFPVISETEHDADGDGFTESLGDCDDDDEDIYPTAVELYDSIDNDCDNLIDEGTVGYDDDNDLYSEIDGDCDDADRTVYPGAKETCDGLDNDCDFVLDEGTSCYDDDSDGYTEDDGDCNDGSAAVSPDATESCDSLDNNCDGSTDPAGSAGCTTYFLDSDGDGYGSATSSSCLCSPSSTYKVTNSTDCYDSNSKASPAQSGYFTSDRGDGSYDYDCDGVEDQRYTTMGSCPTNILRCSADTVVGWKGSTPPKCGASRNMITRCAYDPTSSVTSCTETTSSTVQECQ